MALCPSCEYPISDDRERVGARCPSCRDPLYEPPGRFGCLRARTDLLALGGFSMAERAREADAKAVGIADDEIA